MPIINAGQASRTVSNAMQGLLKRIVDEEATAAADRVRQRIVEEGMRLRFDIGALANLTTQETEVTIRISEAPEKA